MAMLSTRIRMDSDWLRAFEPQLGGSALGPLSSFASQSAAPDHECPAESQQRGCILGHNRRLSDSPGGDDVHRADAGSPRLGACMDHMRVGGVACSDRPHEKVALARRAFNKEDLGLRQRYRKWNPRYSGARAHVRNRSGRPKLGQIERHQRIREVIFNDPRGLTDSGRRERIAREEIDE